MCGRVGVYQMAKKIGSAYTEDWLPGIGLDENNTVSPGLILI